MAGIITNVDSDIQKLSVLKKKIDDVKKALKGIDIKVDIDIAKDLEAQLKSLTGQYDALASKIAETEKKIAVSTKNINESTEKIIKAQQTIMKPSQTDSASATKQEPQVATAQVSAINAQAAAYEDLREEIDKVLGSRAENIKRLVDEEGHIKRLKKEIAELTDKQGKVGLSKGETQRLKDLNNSLIESKISVSQLNQVLKNDAKLGQTAAGSMNRLSQELGRMRMAYRELTDEEKASPFGQTLKASIEEADKKIKELDASIGNHQRNVGNYASSWNGLSFSIQQLAREMPALAYGPTVFFSAISNNLPMLTDEIKKARVEYNKMVAAGQKATPVWKQVAGSIISWQTALVAGITILTMHGDKIIKWIGDLFKGRDAALSTEGAIKKLNEAMDFKDLGSDLANFKRLVGLYKEIGDNAEEKQKFIKDYKEELEKTGIAVNSVAEADKLLIDKTPDYVTAMTLRAKATAAMKLAAENYAEAFEKQAKNAKKIEELEKERDEAEKRGQIKDQTVVMQSSAGAYTQTLSRGVETLNAEIERLKGTAAEEAGNTYITLMESFSEQAEELLKKAGLTTTDEQKAKDKAAKEAAEAAKAKQQAEEKVKEIILNQQRANQDAEIKLMEEGSAKKIAELNKDYERLIETINENEQKVREAQGGKLTKEQQDVFTAARGYAKETRDTGIAAVRAEENKEVEALLKDYQSLIDKYLETDRKFAADRVKLQQAGASDETLAELDYQRDETLDAISLEMARREQTFQAWMNQIANYSLEELRKALTMAEQELALLEKNSPNSKKTALQRAKVVELRGDVVKAEEEAGKKGPAKSEKDWKDLYELLRDIESQFKEIGDAIGGTVGEVIGSAGEIASLGLSMIENIGTISELTITGIDRTASKAAQAIQMVERASVILAIISAAIKIITKIVNLANEMHDKKYEKRIEEMQKKVENLENSYKKLGNTLDRVFAGTAVQTLEQMNKLLKEQQLLIREQIKEENKKKNPDDSKIKDWTEEMDNITEAIEENKKKMEEAIYGESVQQAIENFAEAYADALSSSEDGWVSLRNTARDVMKKMVMETIKESLAGSKAIEKLREAMKLMYEDGILTDLEQDAIYKMADEIQKELDRQFGWSKDLFEDKSTTEQKATYGGFEAMSEDTGSELNGRFTALQMAGEEIKQQAITQTITLSEIKGSIDNYLAANGGSGVQTSIDNILTFVSQSYMELQQINENTAANVKELKSVSSYIKKWDNKIMSL